MTGHLQLDASPIRQVAQQRNWSDQQLYNAKRIIDGGLGLQFGFKEYEETQIGEPDEGGLEGFTWVYYLYNERVDELENLI
jgi:hypothetical protein